MARRLLLDTGFLVALVNRADPDHERCTNAWRPLRAEILSVEGVLVEAAYLLRRVRGGPQKAIALAVAAGVRMYAPQLCTLGRAAELMTRYQNVPMDFVDALLICVAEEADVREILTLDRRGFTVYRVKDKRPLTMIPAD